MDLIAHQSWPTNDGVAGWMCYAMLYWIMDAFEVDNLPADLAAELESRFFWWEPVGLEPRSLARILAQAMNLASSTTCGALKGHWSFSVGRGVAQGRAGMDQRAVLGVLARASGARYRP